MKKFTLFLTMLFAFAITAFAQVNYTPSFTGNRTSVRKILSLRLTSPSYPNHAANSLSLSTSEQQLNYTDKSSVTMKAGVGEPLTMSVSIDGSWMHTYLYIDADNNGFNASIASGSEYLPAGDLLSYSFYNNNGSSDERGWNSVGAVITGDARDTSVLPAFTAPLTEGTYRMRIKMDWCNIDPAGDQDGKFNDFLDNGGHIVDVTLEVAERDETSVNSIFNTTTIEGDAFAQGTTWYTLQLGANGYVIDNGTSSNIALDDVVSDVHNDSHLWAFTGDDINGYRLYNKQEGTGKVLAAPTTMSGQTGATSYPILVSANNVPQGYTDLWLFESSSDLGEGDTYYYMYEKGYPANKVNNRGDIMAFWNEGADGGSTMNIRFAKAEYPVNVNSGVWTAMNAANTWASKWESNNEPKINLLQVEDKKNMAAYDGTNIQLFTCLPEAAINGNYSSQYTISAEEGYSIEGYRFNFVSSGASNVTVTPDGGNPVTANSSATQSVSVSGNEEGALAFTVSSSSNMFANTSDFYATIVRNATPVEESTEIFTTLSGGIPYRIPAIATTSDGNIIAVADYRHSGADIGVVNNGRIDLHAKISNNNGKSWSAMFPIVEGQGAGSNDFMHVGFGDPCIVADRESNRVLVLSCAGNVSFQSGTRSNHQNIARFYSNDNGVNWSEPEDIAESIYSQFDASNAHGPAMAMFIGSGKIHQSRYVKVDNYYRLYCAVLLKNRYATYTNFVLYSDDFGGSWKVLGGVENAPIPSGGDEPKVEELPNGNVIISSRINGGRDFNIFTFTNREEATGSWGTRATSNSNVGGVVALGNSTNGEILILPVVRNEDNAEMWIALQSLPFGSGRNNVGIYYKELASESDYNTPANFAKDWDGRHQASFLPSAYSTMCLQQDTTIGFLYEESTHGADYTIVYKNYTLETITDGAYSIRMDEMPEPEQPNPGQPSEATLELIAEAKELLLIEGLGYPAANPRATLQAAIETAEANPTETAGLILEGAIAAYYAATEVVLPEAGKTYTFTAIGTDVELYIYNNNGTLAVSENTGDELPESAHFVCEIGDNGKYYFKTANSNYYLAYPTIGGKSWLDNESLTGLETEKLKVTEFDIVKILSGGEVSVDNYSLFGLVALNGYRGYDNGKYTDSYGPIVVMHSANTFDGSNAPFFNNNYTSAFRIDEVVVTEPEPVEPLTIVSVTPDEVTNSISTIQITFSHNVKAVGINPSEDLMPLYSNGSIFPIAMGNWSIVGSVLTIRYNEITTVGTYRLDIPENVFVRVDDEVAFEGATFNFTISIPDGIEGVDAENESLVIYDITGRRIEKITDKGLYIINGKKTFIK